MPQIARCENDGIVGLDMKAQLDSAQQKFCNLNRLALNSGWLDNCMP